MSSTGLRKCNSNNKEYNSNNVIIWAWCYFPGTFCFIVKHPQPRVFEKLVKNLLKSKNVASNLRRNYKRLFQSPIKVGVGKGKFTTLARSSSPDALTD